MGVRKVNFFSFIFHLVLVSSMLRSRRLCDMYSLFRQGECKAAAEAAAVELGMYGVESDNKQRWKKFSDFVVEEKNVFTDKPMGEISSFLNTLANHNVSIGSFWSSIFEDKLNGKIKTDKVLIGDLVELISACNKVDYRPDVAIEKLLSILMENETVWVLSPIELVETVKVVSNSYVQNRLFFMEIANRIVLESEDFSDDQLVTLLIAFAKVNMVHSEMCKVVLKRFCRESARLGWDDKILVAHALSKLRFRSDTFFRQICTNGIGLLGLGGLASLGVSMRLLKMDSGSTEWWDKESDFKRIVELVKEKSANSAEIEKLNAKELGNVCQLVSGGMKNTDVVMKRSQHLFVNEPLSRSHRYLAPIMDGLARSKDSHVQVDHLRWVAEWLCGNVYILPTQDIVAINRAIGKLGFKDHNYHKIWVPYYLERLESMSKEDITSVSDTYNAIGMSDTLLGGRHFFYKLGKRFQELTVSQTGDKQLNIDRKYRNLIRRLG
jgi:hypothetical protein